MCQNSRLKQKHVFKRFHLWYTIELYFVIFTFRFSKKNRIVKKLTLILMTVALVFSSCSDNTQYKISGSLSNAEDRYLYLNKLNVDSQEQIDSVLLKKNGEFEFTGNVSLPTFFLLKLSDQNFVTLLVDSAEQVQVYGDAANFSTDYKVDGSEGSSFVQELSSKLVETKHKLDSLETLRNAYENDMLLASRLNEIETEYEEIKQEQIDFSTSFVQEHPFSMANVLALYQKFDADNYVIQDLQSLKVAASALRSFYPESEHVKALYANTTMLMQEEQSASLRELVEQYGENSPDIVLPDVDGNEVALSSLRGKYVLVQFWSAADRASRYQNEALVEIYQKYNSKGFEIYQVSIDTDRYDWVDAIDQDNLSWINVGDMEGSTTALVFYNVQSIPFNYLLDPEGNIIGRNLAGATLTNKLEEIF